MSGGRCQSVHGCLPRILSFLVPSCVFLSALVRIPLFTRLVALSNVAANELPISEQALTSKPLAKKSIKLDTSGVTFVKPSCSSRGTPYDT